MEDGIGESWIAASGVWPTSYKCCINKAFPLLEWHLGLFMRILWINKPLEKRAQEGEKKTQISFHLTNREEEENFLNGNNSVAL